mgnify:CR=1 FL=1|jgi:predicted amidohydrolase YtcJ
MSQKPDKKHGCSHQCGCGCTPTLFVDMIEKVGLALSRRDFIKGTAAMGGVFVIGGLTAPMLAGCKDAPAGSLADAIDFGDPIVTMVKADVMASKGDATRLINLRGKTLMPGFYDPHSHVVLQSVKFAAVNLDPIPIGKIGSIADIQQTLRDWSKEKKPEPGKWVIGWGYDDTAIEEQRHPNRKHLDAVSTADAAGQNFEENRKGTLKKGKLADLSDDPLAIEPMKIRDIQIMETIKEGQRVFSA